MLNTLYVYLDIQTFYLKYIIYINKSQVTTIIYFIYVIYDSNVKLYSVTVQSIKAVS